VLVLLLVQSLQKRSASMIHKKRKGLLNEFNRNVLLLGAELALLVMCACYIVHVYNAIVMPDKRVVEEFGMSTCTVTAKNLVAKSGITPGFRADFDVAYMADGSQVRSVAAANGLDYSYTRDKDEQQAYLDEFAVGDEYPCWYDKANTSKVVMVLRHSWTTTIPLLLPVLLALLLLFFTGRTIIDMFEDKAVKRSRKK
jgi:hypothetical protein